MVARVLLKARPTAAQLSDRLAPPVPAGLELYIDAADITGPAPDWLDMLAARIRAAGAPPDFVYLVEGPIRSLDGGYFDVTRDAPADAEVVNRLVMLAARIGARLVNVHCVGPVRNAATISAAARAQALERARPFLARFVHRCRAEGLTPTIENIPPVSRMREHAYVFSTIGVEPQDLAQLAADVPGLCVTLDVSHAQLYLNAALAGGECGVDRAGHRGKSAARPALEFPLPAAVMLAARQYHERAEVADLRGYAGRLEQSLASAHISNARGLLGEGLRYAGGDVDLDPVVGWLATRVRYLVTEPLEPNNDRATYMREMQTHLGCLLADLPAAADAPPARRAQLRDRLHD